MILLLNYSISLSENSYNPPTGERNDSVLISYDDLRIVNSKLVELEYEKSINTELRQVVENDKIIISDYDKLNKQLNKDCKKAYRTRNIAFGVAGIATIITIIVAVFK